MKHLTADELSVYLDGALAPTAQAEASRHLEGCPECRESLAALEAQDRSLERTLAHDPGDAHFERLAGRIEARFATGERAPREGPLAGVPAAIRAWFDRPRNLVWLGSAAAVMVGAGIVYLTTREATPPPPGVLAERAAQVAPEAPADRADANQKAPPSSEGAPAERDGEREPAAGYAPPASLAPAKDDLARGKPENAIPQRAYEVRRNAAGEDEPVRRERRPFAGAKAAAPEPAPGSSEAVRALKQRFAEPFSDNRPSSEIPAPATVTVKEAATEKEGAPAPVGEDSQVATEIQRLPVVKALAPTSATEAGAAEPAPVTTTPSLAAADRIEAAPVRMCGEVRDSIGRPVAFASVTLITAGRGATTDARGRFCLDAPPGEQALSVMAVGFRPLRQSVRAAAGAPPLALALQAVPVLEEMKAKPGLAGGRSGFAPPPADEQVTATDAFATLPDSLRFLAERAASLRALAERTGSAPRADGAAAAWERLLPLVTGGPAEVETRYRIAAARFRAWELAPTGRRAQAATEALTAFLVRAPAGEQRNKVAGWLDRVKR